MKKRLAVAIILFLAMFAAGYLRAVSNKLRPAGSASPAGSITGSRPEPAGVPELSTAVVAAGLTNVWDVALLPDGQLLITERAGDISLVKEGFKRVILRPTDIVARGEGGLTGMTLDPQYDKNRFVYACYNTSRDIRLTRWRLDESAGRLSEPKDIITGLPTGSGRHSGCRPRFGADGNLWIGTGDAAAGTHPQDPKSLGGKVLRIDRDGKGVPGNLPAPYDSRIYSYGHRNIQGMAMLKKEQNGNYGYSVEHGPGKDDEMNVLAQGNFGWNPVPGYNETVPMTDKQEFPDAIEAIWRSGTPTIAPGGAAVLSGERWKAWQGSIAVAVLKDKHIRILELQDGKVSKETELFAGRFGRIRTANLELDGNLYITTDNGGGTDMVVRITPR